MSSIPQNNRYLPHELNTKFYAVKLYRNGNNISFVCRRYKISKSSLMRWNKKFDGTKESLVDKSHKPLTPHPKAHTEQEIKWIKDYVENSGAKGVVVRKQWWKRFWGCYCDGNTSSWKE